jgi:hypothetical protein
MVSAGAPILSSDINTISSYTVSKPIVRLVQSVAQTGLASNTQFTLTWTSEDIDTNGFHDTSVNTSRITPNVAGYYRVSGFVHVGARSDWQLIYARFRFNNVTNISPSDQRIPGAFSFGPTAYTTAMVTMNGSTDFVELVCTATNTAAATFSTVVSPADQCSVFEMELMRPL